jgi:hypothetical protein
MIKTPNAGSTARGGILGKRKRVRPEPPSYVTMWQGGRLVRCLLSEARKSTPEAALAERQNDPCKVQHFRGSPGARTSPDPRSKQPPRCRYCGAASTGPRGAPQICTGCEKLRDRHEPQATIPSIADKMRADPALPWSQARDSDMWIGDDKLYLRVQRTLANRERAAAAEEFQKHGPGRLEHEGPVAKVAEVVEKAKRVARAQFRQRQGAEAA